MGKGSQFELNSILVHENKRNQKGSSLTSVASLDSAVRGQEN